jgi:hypothetical protein
MKTSQPTAVTDSKAVGESPSAQPDEMEPVYPKLYCVESQKQYRFGEAEKANLGERATV